MSEIGAYEAKTHFSEPLERAAKCESVSLTRRGELVAYLIPAGSARPTAEVVDDLRELRKGLRFDGNLRAATQKGRL